MTALVLPAIPRHVPRAHRFDRGTRQAVRLAEILLDLGLLKAQRPYASPRELCEKSLCEWAAGRTGPLHVLGNVALVVSLSGAADWFDLQEQPAPDLNPEDCVLFVLAPWDEASVYTLHQRCTAIERRHPGLAQTALALLHVALWRTVYSWSPAVAYEWRDQWPGWDGEEGEGLTLEQFAAAVPEWAFKPRRKFTRPKLAALARDPVAAATLALDEALRAQKLTPDVGTFWHAEFACELRWSLDDEVGAMADDYENDVRMSGEATDDFSVHVVELTQRAVAQWLEGAGRMLHTLGCVDRLLALLTEEVH